MEDGLTEPPETFSSTWLISSFWQPWDPQEEVELRFPREYSLNSLWSTLLSPPINKRKESFSLYWPTSFRNLMRKLNLFRRLLR